MGIIKKMRNIDITSKKGGYYHIPAILWIITAITFVFLLCSHTYNDILITAKQGYNFWNLLFEGRPFDFYKESIMVSGNEMFPDKQGAAYLFPLYFIFAVWNLPTWLIEKISGCSLYNTIPSMIWMKLMLAVFAVFSTIIVYRIVSRIPSKKEYAYLAAFLFASSAILLYSTALIGQYDIITTTFILIGIDGWVTKNKKKFLIAFSISLLFKYFALLYFLPLLLISEKKIRKIVLYFAQAIIPVVVFLFVFPKPKGQGSNVSNMIGIFFNGIKFDHNVSLYVFPVIVVVVLVICYFSELSDSDRFHYGMYYIGIIMGAFCVINNPYPYWCILAVPSFILLTISSNNMNKTILLETFLCLGIAVKGYIINPLCFGYATVKGMGIIPAILGKEGKDLLPTTSILGAFQLNDKVNSLVFTGLFILFVLLLFFARPRAPKQLLLEPLSKMTIYMRTVINVLVVVAPTIYIIYLLLNKG